MSRDATQALETIRAAMETALDGLELDELIQLFEAVTEEVETILTGLEEERSRRE